MARITNSLSDTRVKSLSVPGRYADGNGLYLYVKPSGARSWVYRWKEQGKRRELGLGGYPTVSLARARQRAKDARESLLDGSDPILEKKRASEPLFQDCVTEFLEARETEWRNEKHRAQWRMTLTKYAKPIARKRVSKVGTEDILRVLKPIWTEKHETASRLRGRIERVLDYAEAHGWRSGDNPARWRGHLKDVLPARQKLTRGHHSAIDYKDLPAFMKALRANESVSARALEFLILTASRTGEVIGAEHGEIDTVEMIWTVPAERMKAGREHRVPLVDRASEIAQQFAGVSDYLFPGGRRGRPLSNMAMAKVLLNLHRSDITVHGFRSAFRDWVGDSTKFPREIAEQALAHRVGNATEQAYRRRDALERRRELMEAWAGYLEEQPANVVKISSISRVK